MRTLWVVATLALMPALAKADENYTQLGGFFGPRIFSQHGLLGYNDDQPYHPDLVNGVGLGVRAGRSFYRPWLIPEAELDFVPTKTTTIMNVDTNVVWLEPRVQARIDLMQDRRLDPFVIVGAGMPIALSGARKTFNSGIVGEGYIGGGVRFDSNRGFMFRFDARITALPAERRLGLLFDYVNLEADFNIGIELSLGKPAPRSASEQVATPDGDRDGDSITDKNDRCPEQPEDKDGFEDTDGCPEIDNDGDRVIDAADKCATELETLNGFQDDDGCPDTLPAEIAALRGTIEGLLYAEGETVVRESAKKSIQKLAKTLIANPSVRIVLVGHTDDREAKTFASGNQDVAAIATDLAKARAEAVRQALVGAGISGSRLVVDGAGAESPVADNGTAKGRLANRRVELKLYVAQ